MGDALVSESCRHDSIVLMPANDRLVVESEEKRCMYATIQDRQLQKESHDIDRNS